jgi:D-glycero-alpha-D-manno-heptose-7-phosphate kinase
VTIRQLLPYFGLKYRASWSVIEEASDINGISHPSIRECVRESGLSDGLEIHTVGDLPARSGLGSSSSFTASMIKGLCEYRGKAISSNELIKETIRIEQEILKENVGIQDQIAVCQGGFGMTRIRSDSTFSTIYMDNNERIVEMIDRQLILVYSGIARSSSAVQTLKRQNLEDIDKNLDCLKQIAHNFSDSILDGSLTPSLFINLMKTAWNEKRKTMEGLKCMDEIDYIYQKALTCGATCGKLLGAGGGGFFAFFVHVKEQETFISGMKPYVAIKANIHYKGVERVA